MDAFSKRKKFEELLSQHINAVERLVYYKIPIAEDAKDILQEVCLTAFLKFDTLRDTVNFKAWLIKIAYNKCNDYFRKVFASNDVQLEAYMTYSLTKDRTGIAVKEAVAETMDKLSNKDKQVLQLFYLKQLPIKEIAKRLDIPIGTVKSRLNAARNNFKRMYPFPPIMKGESVMCKNLFPDKLPDIKITKSNSPIFDVVCLEVPGWFIIPKLGEKASWAIYDYPEKKLSETTHMTVTEKASVHGVECVEIVCEDFNAAKIIDKSSRRLMYVKLTDTHIQNIADCHYNNDVKVITTFLDDDFLADWGAGKDNCGFEINLKQNGNCILKADGSIAVKQFDWPDVLGRYDVIIGNKSYETILLIEVDSRGPLVERYIDRNGRTVLFRRYNKNDWGVGENKHYKKPWTETLPNNERLIVNEDIYVHWYDCISDYVL